MMTLFTGLHAIGLGVFLGSILTFVVASTLASGASFTHLFFARRIVRTGTLFLTIPSLWLATLARVAQVIQQRPAAPSVVWSLAPFAILLLTSHVLIVPATARCLEYAAQAERNSQLDSGFRRAYLMESVPGALNVIVTLCLLASH